MAGNRFIALEGRSISAQYCNLHMCYCGVRFFVCAISLNVFNSLASLIAVFGNTARMLVTANHWPAERLAGSCRSAGMKPNYKKQDETNDFGN